MPVVVGQELTLERRMAHLERELLIRDREEHAARREMARVTEQLMRHSRASRTQLERARAEGATALDAAMESTGAAVEVARVQAAATIATAREELQVERERAGRLQQEASELRDVLAAATAEAAELSAERSAQDSLLQQLRGELDRAEDERQAARAQLESALRERARERAEHSARARRLEQNVSALSVGLSQTRGDIERAAGSRAWRLGHLITRTLARIARRPTRTRGALVAALARIDRVQSAVRLESAPSALGAAGTVAAIGPGVAPGEVVAGSPAAQIGPGALVLAPDPLPPQLRFSPAQERELERRRASLATELRERLGPPPERERWPSVSAIVPTRDGLGHLKRLFAGLTVHTRYPELEVVVVDNASSDGTLAYLESLQTPFPVHVVANEENLSYAQANARGVERASGELLLFLNNDIEPFEPGWLKELVAALESEGVGAVGATLLHPEDLDGSSPTVPGQPRSGDSELLPTEDLDGARSDDSSAGGRARMNGSPAPEPLVQHRTIRFRWQDGMVKGFNHGDGDGLWEGAFGSELRAPAVTAACMLMAREHFERVGGFGAGYRYGTEDVDLGLKLLVSGAESAGVGRAVLFHRESSSQNRASRDFRRLNRLENRRLFLECWGPQTLREYRLARLRRDPFWTDGSGAHVAITLTSLDVADGWGDWYSGHEIGDALEAIGWRVSYVERKGDRWYELPEDLDYVLSLMDPFDLRRVPEHVSTIVWIRNWTERWLERPWFERADVLLVSSQGSAELIEARTGRRTIRFPLAVNPARFHPQPAEERFVCDYAFTGNWWGKDRDIQRALAPRDGERLLVYGKDWEQVPELAPYARGELPYEQLALLYPSAKLVLDDTQGPTLPYGAVNARVFDALAAGTLVITNCESGVRELFDEEFPVWSSREDLRAALDELLGDDARRAELTARYRETVLTRHTYAHRAARLREILLEHEQRLSFCLKIGAPNREVAPTWGDLHFAESLARELRRRGHRTLIQTLDEWEDEGGLDLRCRPAPQGPLALSPQARPVQCAVVDQPPRRAHGRGVRRLRPRRGRLAAVRGTAAAAHCHPGRRSRAGDRPVGDATRSHARAGARAGVRRQLAQRAATDRPRPAAHRARSGDLGDPLGGLDRHLAARHRARAQRRAAPRVQLRRDCPQRPLGRHARARLHLQPHLRRPRLRRARAERRRARPGRALRRRRRGLPLARGAARADRAAAGRSRRAPPPRGGGPGHRAGEPHLRPPDRRAARGGAGARAGAHPCPPPACRGLSSDAHLGKRR